MSKCFRTLKSNQLFELHHSLLARTDADGLGRCLSLTKELLCAPQLTYRKRDEASRRGTAPEREAASLTQEPEMTDNIRFSLRNNQDRDVIVQVSDRNTGTWVLDSYALRREETVGIDISAGTSGEGRAEWIYWSPDGLVNSRKLNDHIRNGDKDTLG